MVIHDSWDTYLGDLYGRRPAELSDISYAETVCEERGEICFS